MMMALKNDDGVISTITNLIQNDNRFPIYVAEGTSEKKMAKIKSNAYLTHCYDKLKESTGPMFIYGHISVDALQRTEGFSFGQKALHKAIKQLLELGYLTVFKSYHEGKHGRIFQLSKPNDVV